MGGDWVTISGGDDDWEDIPAPGALSVPRGGLNLSTPFPNGRPRPLFNPAANVEPVELNPPSPPLESERLGYLPAGAVKAGPKPIYQAGKEAFDVVTQPIFTEQADKLALKVLGADADPSTIRKVSAGILSALGQFTDPLTLATLGTGAIAKLFEAPELIAHARNAARAAKVSTRAASEVSRANTLQQLREAFNTAQAGLGTGQVGAAVPEALQAETPQEAVGAAGRAGLGALAVLGGLRGARAASASPVPLVEDVQAARAETPFRVGEDLALLEGSETSPQIAGRVQTERAARVRARPDVAQLRASYEQGIQEAKQAWYKHPGAPEWRKYQDILSAAREEVAFREDPSWQRFVRAEESKARQVLGREARPPATSPTPKVEPAPTVSSEPTTGPATEPSFGQQLDADEANLRGYLDAQSGRQPESPSPIAQPPAEPDLVDTLQRSIEATKPIELPGGFTARGSPRTGTFGLHGPDGEKVAVRVLGDRIELVSIGKGRAPDSRSAVQALREFAAVHDKPVYMTSTNLSESGGKFVDRMVQRGDLVPTDQGLLLRATEAGRVAGGAGETGAFRARAPERVRLPDGSVATVARETEGAIHLEDGRTVAPEDVEYLGPEPLAPGATTAPSAGGGQPGPAVGPSPRQAQPTTIGRLRAAIRDFAGHEGPPESQRSIPGFENKPPKMTKGQIAADILDLPRTALTAPDLSYLLNQGLILGSGHPVVAAKGAVKMVKAFASSSSADAAYLDLARRPNAPLYKAIGLDLTTPGAFHVGDREERFLNRLVEKIPVFREMVRASDRASSTLMNHLRAEAADKMIASAKQMGLSSARDFEAFKWIGNYINDASGRGHGEALKKAAPVLNRFFFSTRRAVSRVQMFDPRYYLTAPAPVRREAWRNLMATAGFVGTGLGLAALAGAKVSTDLRSSDAFRARFGNTVVDFSGGLQPQFRLLAQLATGQRTTRSGEVKELSGKGPYPETRFDRVVSYVRGKLHPAPGLAADLLAGKTMTGQKATIPTELWEHFVNMSAQDVAGVVQEHGWMGLLSFPYSILGGQVYSTQQQGATSRDREPAERKQ